MVSRLIDFLRRMFRPHRCPYGVPTCTNADLCEKCFDDRQW
jgi:hypothetical protein